MNQNHRHKSYEFTQRLTFFVIGLMTVVCGYLLLNAEKFAEFKYTSILYLIGGLAILSGFLWRFFYNQTYHEEAHGDFSRVYPVIKFIQIIVYWIYVILTALFLISLLVVGYQYIHALEDKPQPTKIEESTKSPKK